MLRHRQSAETGLRYAQEIEHQLVDGISNKVAASDGDSPVGGPDSSLPCGRGG